MKGPVSLGIHLSINTFWRNIYSLSRITFSSFVLHKWRLCRMLWALLPTISTQQCYLINLKGILDAHISQFCSHYIMGGLQPGLISPWFLLLMGVLMKELWWGAVSLSLFNNNWTLQFILLSLSVCVLIKIIKDNTGRMLSKSEHIEGRCLAVQSWGQISVAGSLQNFCVSVIT